MGEEIRSSLEIALEKAEKLGKATKEELLWEKQKERALSLVGKLLKGEAPHFKEEVSTLLRELNEPFRKRALKTILEALLNNLILPRDELHLKEMKDILKALRGLLSELPQLEKILLDTEKMLEEYLQSKEALYQELERRFAASLSALEKAVSEEMGAKVKLNPEAHPQFQEEWRKVKEHLEAQYGKHLSYIKNLLLKVLA